MHLISVNLGRAEAADYTDAEGGVTGHGKRPVPGPVRVFAPGPRATGLGSGVEGDAVCDRRHHGGDHQAVYAYAREDWTTGRPSWAASCLAGPSARTSPPPAST